MQFAIAQLQRPEFSWATHPPTSPCGVCNGGALPLNRDGGIHEMFLFPLGHNALVIASMQTCTTVVRSLPSKFLIRVHLFVQLGLIDFAADAAVCGVRDPVIGTLVAGFNDLGGAENEVTVLLDVLLPHEVLGHQIALELPGIPRSHYEAAIFQQSVLSIHCDSTGNVPSRGIRDADHIRLSRSGTNVRNHLLGVIRLRDQEVEGRVGILPSAWQEVNGILNFVSLILPVRPS
mmetsp:Transcript_50963/g.81347  ORF Transcript_50963/g.81347 Transcript_50963/m.81347 type:complete len:233 (-) Transcript_50963:126-824(-)